MSPNEVTTAGYTSPLPGLFICTTYRLLYPVLFYVSLTVHLSITLANDQLDAQILNTFIIILYMYMF